ncbi:MAG: HlyD family efflux transporter periplasmic adaptor subunit [Bacteroidota bacterium]
MLRITIYTLIICSLMACGQELEETKPIRRTVMENVFASGVLAAEHTYRVTARTEGYLESVTLEVNQVVEAGQTVATIDNRQNALNAQNARTLYKLAEQNTTFDAPKLQQAKLSMQQAQQQLDYDKQQAERYEKLLAANSVARVMYEQAALQYQNSQMSYENAVQYYAELQRQADKQLVEQKTQKQLTQTLVAFHEIQALRSGRVLQLLKETGDYVRPGDVIAVIGNTDLLYAEVNIDESNIRKVGPQQMATVQLNVEQKRTYSGKVKEILPTFDQATQSFIAKIYFTESLDFRYVGTQLQANILVDSTENALLIPRQYLSYGNEVHIKSQEAPVRVETKVISSDWVQVVSGIDENAVLLSKNIH